MADRSYAVQELVFSQYWTHDSEFFFVIRLVGWNVLPIFSRPLFLLLASLGVMQRHGAAPASMIKCNRHKSASSANVLLEESLAKQFRGIICKNDGRKKELQ